MRIVVEQSDIDRGCRDSGACPIALALARTTGEVWIVAKLYARRATDYKLTDINPLPSVAQTFVKNYDAGRSVQPFEFDLNPIINPDGTLSEAVAL